MKGKDFFYPGDSNSAVVVEAESSAFFSVPSLINPVKICIVKMDLLKKMMGLDGHKDDDDDKRKKKPAVKDEFRKPIWVEEYDSDDDLFDNQKIFGVQVFTNPLEIQKHFEHQIQEMMKSLEEYDETVKPFDRNLKQDFLKPGFEDEIKKELQKEKRLDTDLDGEIYPEQLHTLFQRISPNLKELLPKKKQPEVNSIQQPKLKLTDEQKILDWIHGYKESEPQALAPRPRISRKIPSQRYHDGIFEGTFQGPRMFGQSIISQTIRKPDGTYETRKTVRDSEGHTKTTITRSTKDGQKETITTYGDDGGPASKSFFENASPQSGGGNNDGSVAAAMLGVDQSYRKHLFSKNGYVLPKNLWWLQAQTNRNELTTSLVDHRFSFHFSFNTYFPTVVVGVATASNLRCLTSFSEPNMCVVESDLFHSASERDNHCRLNHPDNHYYYSIEACMNTRHMVDDKDVSEQQTETVWHSSNTEYPVVLVSIFCNLVLALVITISLSRVQFLILWYNNCNISYQQLAEGAPAVVRQRIERTSIMANSRQQLGRLWKLVQLIRRFNRCCYTVLDATSARRRLSLWYFFTLDSYRYDLSNKFAIISLNHFNSWLLWLDLFSLCQGSAISMKHKTKFLKASRDKTHALTITYKGGK